MKLSEIIEIIDSKYPEKLQYQWDNSGLNLGDKESDIKKILVTLEVNNEVVNEAIEKKVDLIISHHPMLFSKINRIEKSDIKGNLIYNLIKNNISVYCMHTNYDIAFDGLNDYFMEKIGAESGNVFDKIGSDDEYHGGSVYGLGRVAELVDFVEVTEIIEIIKNNLSIENLRYVGNLDQKIKKFAVVTGSGAEYFEKAKHENLDLLITGDVKYHNAMDALELGISIIDCGHFGSEKIFSDSIFSFISTVLNGVEIIKTERLNNPFKSL
ncbi:Nif3-like dinuclear metal center hexameric protein [Peptostreptococcus faecalis]|uniref:Nif3-like dinuclear metal center hexameric protein n=1 Tax=Peptostreptococcus faecalis TaxID=2045015 RepID=UPI000C7B64AA|nr:Nif3-like dinuclear metal center hexameric protein [Peptostreptococcus faecalis]